MTRLDPVALLAIAGLTAIVGVAAAFVPGRRAARLDILLWLAEMRRSGGESLERIVESRPAGWRLISTLGASVRPARSARNSASGRRLSPDQSPTAAASAISSSRSSVLAASSSATHWAALRPWCLSCSSRLRLKMPPPRLTGVSPVRSRTGNAMGVVHASR